VAVQADWLEKDLYAVLGVAEDSDQKTVGRAYRKLARDLHPDTHPDDPAAAERFKEVTAAYDVIGDPTKRAEYDEFRRAVAGERERASWAASQGPAWTRYETDGFFDPSSGATIDPDDLEDLFSSLLGRTARRGSAPRRGADLEAVLALEFEDAVHGLTTSMPWSGSGGIRCSGAVAST
jgi:molecular chaperone DnaJ